MISRQPMNQKVQQQFLHANNSRQEMNYTVPQHHLIGQQTSLEKSVGKYRAEEDRVRTKHKHLDGEKNQSKTKRTFRNSVIRSLRAGDRIVVPKALDEFNTDENATVKKSTANRACQYMRPTRCNHGNHGYVTQATKNMDEKNKKYRKRSVVGSLASILGPEEGSGTISLPAQPDNGVRLASEKKLTRNAIVPDDESLDLHTDQKKQTVPPTSQDSPKQREEKSEKDRKQCVRGSLTSILGTAERILNEPDDHAEVDPGKLPTTKVVVKEGSLLGSRKKLSTRRLSRTLKRCEEKRKKKDQDLKPIGSLASAFGPEEKTSVTPTGLVRLTSRKKPTSTDLVAIATSGTSSPTLTTRKGQNSNLASKKDNKQIVEQKLRTMRNMKQFEFNEKKVREQIRARLRKNQQKYEALGASLSSTRAKSTPDHISSTTGAPTLSFESTRALIAKSFSKGSTSTSQQPRLRSRARNGRLYSVCKRIPATIHENSELGFGKSQDTRIAAVRERRSSQGSNKKSSIKAKASSYPQSPKKAKASFYPRSPKSSPGRNRRRFRVLAPHPTECAGSCNENHGGLCMTFPTKSKKGNRTEEKERRISVERIQGLMLIQ